MNSGKEKDLFSDTENSDLIDRMKAVYEETGFFPHTNRELSLAKGALEVQDKPGGFGKYINKVLLHQMKSKSEKPEKVVAKITAEVANFIQDARAAYSFSDELQGELDESHQFVTIDQVFGDNWMHQGTTRRALGDFNRRHVINGMLDGEIDIKKIDEVNNVESIGEMMVGMSVYEADKLVELIKEEELQRSAFWKKQQAGSMSHMLVSGDTMLIQ